MCELVFGVGWLFGWSMCEVSVVLIPFVLSLLCTPARGLILPAEVAVGRSAESGYDFM